MDSINNRIYNFLLDDGNSRSSLELLRMFFKMDISDEIKAELIISPLLSNDSRFVKDNEGRWKARKVRDIEELPLTEVNFLLFYINERNIDLKKLDFSIDELRDLLPQISFFVIWKNFGTEVVKAPFELLSNSRNYVFVPYNRSSISFLKRIYRRFVGSEPDFKILSLRYLIRALFPDKSTSNWESVAEDFNLDYPEPETPESKLKTLISVFSYMIVEAQKHGCMTLAGLIELSSERIKKVDFSRYDFDRDFLKAIPEMPGVYVFKDRNGSIIYVGKASNLRTRINSYFWNTGESPEKIDKILNKLYRIEYKILGSELSALLEEYRLIKKYLPDINVKIDVGRKSPKINPKILIMPSASEGELELFFLADNIPMKSLFYSGREDSSVISILKEIDESTGYVLNAEKNIAVSYFNQYEEFINRIEVDSYSGYEDILRVLKNYLRNIDELFGLRMRYI